MDLVSVGIFICALAVTLVMIYISFVLKRVTSTIKSLGSTLGEVEVKLNYLTPELEQTIQETGKMVDDLNSKLAATDTLFDTTGNLGTSLNAYSQMMDEQRKKLPKYTSTGKLARVLEGVKWSEAVKLLYWKWKK